jgi:hypothetical protein
MTHGRTKNHLVALRQGVILGQKCTKIRANHTLAIFLEKNSGFFSVFVALPVEGRRTILYI